MRRDQIIWADLMGAAQERLVTEGWGSSWRVRGRPSCPDATGSPVLSEKLRPILKPFHEKDKFKEKHV